ncbi:MAG: hypothetical protein AAF889_06210 [Cyanobacteria bacterium P01_D01_bin.73]
MKILVTGNSGAGKTTIAKKLVDDYSLTHLDLDELAWLPVEPPRRRLVADSLVEMEAFAEQHLGWGMEGCYADLLEAIAPEVDMLDASNLQGNEQ